MIETWYYVDHTNNNRITGPITRRDLDVLLKTNALDSNSYVYREGLNGWTQIRDVRDLCSQLMGICISIRGYA